MTTTELPDIETPEGIGELEWKALPREQTSSPLTGVVDHDDAEGTITALVAITGVEDEVGDTIEYGACERAIRRLKPKGVLNHDWGKKVSRLVWSEELRPGDPRLPKTTPDGQPWPAAAGGLLVKAQYNLAKESGRDAYEDAKFYGPEECFSIGYKVRPGGGRRRGTKRRIFDLDIYEWSQVLHGAHKLATLTGVKSLSDAVTDPDPWYDEHCSGDIDEGTFMPDGLEFKARIVRNAEFWGLPIGTPIRAGARPRGQARSATPEEIAATTAPEDESGEAPGGQRGTAPGATAQLNGPGVAPALTALHERYQEVTTSKGPQAGAQLAMLSQFAAPGADVHASPDGQLAALRTQQGWVLLDTANLGTFPLPPGEITPGQIDDALTQLAELGIPWSDLDARRKRWADEDRRNTDRDAVRAILGGLTPFDKAGIDAQTARRDAEGAITEQDRDELADALTRMGLPEDQDPREVAAGLLVLPTEVATRRLDQIVAPVDDIGLDGAVAPADAEREARYAAARRDTGVPDDHSDIDIAPIPGTAIGAPRSTKPDPLRPALGMINYGTIQKRSHPAHRDAALRQLTDDELAMVKREATRRGGHGVNMLDSVRTEEIRRRISPDELRKRADTTSGGAFDGMAKRMRERADDYERRDTAGIGRHDFEALPLGEQSQHVSDTRRDESAPERSAELIAGDSVASGDLVPGDQEGHYRSVDDRFSIKPGREQGSYLVTDMKFPRKTGGTERYGSIVRGDLTKVGEHLAARRAGTDADSIAARHGLELITNPNTPGMRLIAKRMPVQRARRDRMGSLVRNTGLGETRPLAAVSDDGTFYTIPVATDARRVISPEHIDIYLDRALDKATSTSAPFDAETRADLLDEITAEVASGPEMREPALAEPALSNSQDAVRWATDDPELQKAVALILSGQVHRGDYSVLDANHDLARDPQADARTTALIAGRIGCKGNQAPDLERMQAAVRRFEAGDTTLPALAIGHRVQFSELDPDAGRYPVTGPQPQRTVTGVVRTAKREANGQVYLIADRDPGQPGSDQDRPGVAQRVPADATLTVLDDVAGAVTAEQTPGDSVPVPDEQLATADRLRAAALGIEDGPDGEVTLTEAAASRQDRVEAILEAGATALKTRSAMRLGEDRRDLVDELALQNELARRAAEAKRELAAARAAQGGTASSENGEGGNADTVEDARPTVRPGVAGAAEDLGDALNANPRDPETARIAAERFAKLLRRNDSLAFDDLRTTIGDDIHAAIESDQLKAGMLFAAAAALREQRRLARNAAARQRRKARRIDRERIRALIGMVDAELRGRLLDPDDYGGPLTPADAEAQQRELEFRILDESGRPSLQDRYLDARAVAEEAAASGHRLKLRRALRDMGENGDLDQQYALETRLLNASDDDAVDAILKEVDARRDAEVDWRLPREDATLDGGAGDESSEPASGEPPAASASPPAPPTPDQFRYTGEPTSYEDYRRRADEGLKPRRYLEHDTVTGRTRERPDLARGGTPEQHPDWVAAEQAIGDRDRRGLIDALRGLGIQRGTREIADEFLGMSYDEAIREFRALVDSQDSAAGSGAGSSPRRSGRPRIDTSATPTTPTAPRRAVLVQAAEAYAARYGGPDSPTPGANNAARYIIEGHVTDATREEWDWLADYIKAHPELLTRPVRTDIEIRRRRQDAATALSAEIRGYYDRGEYGRALALLDEADALYPGLQSWDRIRRAVITRRGAEQPGDDSDSSDRATAWRDATHRDARPTPAEPQIVERAPRAEDFPPGTPVRLYQDWDVGQLRPDLASDDYVAVRRARNGNITVRHIPTDTVVDVFPRQLERIEQGAQSGDADEPPGRDGRAVVPPTPPGGVREAGGQADVLREPGGAGSPGDRAGSGRPGRPGPGRGDLPSEDRPAPSSTSRSNGAGDAPDTARPTAPGLPGGGLPDTPDERRSTASGDGGVRRGDSRAGAAESGDGAGSDADPAATTEPDVTKPVTTVEHDAAAGADEPVSDDTPELPGEQPPVDTGQLDAIPDTGENFRPTGAEDFAPAGKKAKLEANLAALRTLRQLQAEHRPATEDEQRVLARWAGWGGLPEVFDDTKPDYERERQELRGLLSELEWNEARRNTLNAHYTDPRVVQSVWAAVTDLGFDGGRVLEPGSGSGTFIAFAPEGADMVGVELDSTTAAISHALYPQATIRNESFADTRIPAGSMDLAIGNVPFGDFALNDRIHNPGRKHSIHNHFILKSLAATKPGGICALLTSRYTLDSQGQAARRQMAEMADLIGAVRLPTGSHSKASGTDVIEDILIFRRREPGAEPLTGQDWVSASKRDINGQQITINDYFTAHPEQVLGEITAEPGQYGSGSLIVAGDKTMTDLPAALARLTDAAREQGIAASARLDDVVELTGSGQDQHDGYIGVDADGGFTQVSGGAAVPFAVPAAQAEELRALLGLRDTLRALLDAEAASVSNSPRIRELRGELNDRYDAHVARYGPINRYRLSSSGARSTPGQGGFRRDPMSAIVRALEVYDPETGTAVKTSIFTKRSVSPREILTTADNPADALALCMDTYGEVRLGEIARMLGVDETQARAQLGDLVFEQPPLTEAEQNAAWDAHVEQGSSDVVRLARYGNDGIESAPGVDLSSVGESVRAAGRLEPAAAYLSGNVRRKLAAARAAAAHDERFQANVDALEKVIPTDLGIDEVDGRLGAAWIGANDVRDFLRDLIHDGEDQYNSIRVATSGGGIWVVEGADWGKRATEQWGTDRISAGAIVAALLEQRTISIRDTIDGKTYPNLEATIAAQAKAEEISERFSEWLWEDSDRTRRLLAAYNNQFNAVRLRSYDNMSRVFPGMADTFIPRDHQVAAVNRVVSERCALLAHVVGAGKTAEEAMAAMELKRLGMAQKPAIIIPNHMLEQFSREFLQIYPNAKILAAGTDDLKGDQRREFVARAATGEWDCVILTQSAMELIPMSRDATSAYIDRELATMREQLTQARADAQGDAAKEKTVKKMETAVLKAEEALKAKLDKRKDAGVTFEQTGIDYLFVDEAHQYSNLRTLSNIQGTGATGSDRASDLHMKIEHLRATNASGRVATFATGTPIRNTVTQAYIMQRFLDPDTLREAGIHSFDQWAATFGQVVSEMELKPEGTGFRQATRFAKFRNVPELLRLFHLFADIKTAEDLDLPTPKLATGAVQNIVVPPSEELRAYIRELGERADDVRAGRVKPEDDNMLKISGDGRKAALSMHLVGQDHQPGKIEAAAENIATIWAANKDRPVPCDINDPAGGDCPPPGGMQIVFCDMGVPGARKSVKKDDEKIVSSGDYDAPDVDLAGWNAYDELRDQLVARGVERSSIRFMHEARNDREKAELFAAARNGQVSVLIGSTEKMGVGTNVQRRAVALHHLDAPWRPSDVEQRDGRIMRQGNANAEVAIYRYVTEGSFDAYMWQTLERKKKFIDQIMRGKMGDIREIEDVGDTALSYAEVKALATGNPLLMEKAKIDVAVGKLGRLERQHARTQTGLRRDADAYETNAAEADRIAELLQEAIDKRTDTAGERFTFVIGGRRLTNRVDAAAALKEGARDILYSYGPRPAYLGTFGGHDLMGQREEHVDKRGVRRLGITLSWDGLPGTTTSLTPGEIDNLGEGVLTRLRNSLDGFESRRDLQRDRAASLRSEVEQMRSRIGLPFTRAQELATARAESARLQAAMEEAGLDATGAAPATDHGLATARAKAGAKATAMGRGTWNKGVKEMLRRYSNPAASGPAYASADGAIGAMTVGGRLRVFLTDDGHDLHVVDLGDKGMEVDDPQALVDDLAGLGLPLDEGRHGLSKRWNDAAGDINVNDWQVRGEAIRAAQEVDEARIREVWQRHLRPVALVDESELSGMERARKRVTAAIPHTQNTDTAKMLKRFVNAGPRIPTYAAPDGSIAAVTDTDGQLVLFGTGTGVAFNLNRYPGPFDDPIALLAELTALGIPFGEGEALRERWRDQAQRAADVAAVATVLERHEIAEKGLPVPVISAAELARAQEIKAAGRGDEDESFVDVVEADVDYQLDASGTLQRVTPCPRRDCTGEITTPVFGDTGDARCPACGAKRTATTVT